LAWTTGPNPRRRLVPQNLDDLTKNTIGARPRRQHNLVVTP